tara:strand:+ start:173 stop:292 length:120 start_codon:yes stop_codon:yes gene_type:complete
MNRKLPCCSNVRTNRVDLVLVLALVLVPVLVLVLVLLGL